MTDPKLNEEERLILSKTEAMYSVNGIPFVVSKRIIELMKKKVGKKWTDKYLVENKPLE